MRRRISLLPVVSGIAGVALAHAGAYVLAVPNSTARDSVLHANGHGYWHHATEFGLIAAALAVIMAAGRGLHPVPRGRPGAWLAWRGLVVWQISLFTCLEAGERIAAGKSVTTLLQEPVFIIGLGLQVVVAAVVLLLLAGVERVVAAALHAYRAAALRPARAVWRPVGWLAPAAVAGSRPQSRGPPA